MMGYMSSYDIMRLLDEIDREYINIAKNSENAMDKKFASKAHFVMGNVKRRFKQKLEDK